MKTIVPAAGNYWLLTYRGDANYPDYSKEQVIAWAIDPDAREDFPDLDSFIRVTPITSEGEPGKGWAVLHPDGTVTTITGSWKNLEHWLEYKRSVAAEKKERERKAKATAEDAPTAI